jgi:pimeloyl-ACP methyl ester carboxylesterase
MTTHWTQHEIDVNGIRIHYTRTGDGGLPPLVLLHGFSDSGMCWLRAARELEADYDLILPDARGHGRSARLRAGEVVDMAADLEGLIRGLGLNRPVVGGHSMGANVAGLAAERHPGLISALVLEDPGWGDREEREEEPEEPRPNPFAEWLLDLEGWSLEQIKAKCRQDSPTWDEEELPAWAESKQQLDKTIFQTENAADHDWRRITAGLSCPTLLLTADVDRGAIVTPVVAAEIARLNPLVQAVHIPGAGHNIRRERFGEFMDTVGNFLRSLRE